ncbi:MAG: hypothetical protein FJ299_12945 [Planctomycetes bacterium]|nr:hypothetical protein [Planctomycetota bacterium]
MNRRLAWSVHTTSLLVAGSGIALAWCVYLRTPADPEALVDPLQGLLQHAHVLAAPLSTLALGAAWAMHAWPKWRGGERQARASGLTLIGLSLPMILSGYLLQIASSLEARAAWSLVHTWGSLAWTAVALLHVARARRWFARAAPDSTVETP